MDAEPAKEELEHPGDRVVVRAAGVFAGRFFTHGGDEKKIDDPTNEEQPASEQPDDTRDGLSVIKPVNPDEPENPHQVSDSGAVRRVFGCCHVRSLA